MIEVYPPGCYVRLDNGLTVRVVAVFIRGEAVSYEVAWWDDVERRTAQVEALEVEGPHDGCKVQVGFKVGQV